MATTREDWMEQARREQEGRELLAARVADLEAALQRTEDVAEGARQRADMAEKAMEEAHRTAGARAEALARELEQAQEAGREARAAVTLAHAPLANVWLWQGDGGDKPESLACPVVMSADTLRGLLAEAERWKATAGWVPLSVREGVTTPEEWAQRGEAFVRGLQEEREKVRAALAKALAPPGGTVSGSLPLAVEVLAQERDGLRERMESCHAEHVRTEQALANARRFQESAARDRDALACEVERLTRQLALLDPRSLETMEKTGTALASHFGAALDVVARFRIAGDALRAGLFHTHPSHGAIRAWDAATMDSTVKEALDAVKQSAALRWAGGNLAEFVRMLLLDLDRGDGPHIAHAKECVFAWLDRWSEAVRNAGGDITEHVAQLESDLHAAREGLTTLEGEVAATLDSIPGAVRVREGGGPENLAASLAVTASALASRVTAEKGSAQEAASRLEAVRTGAEQAIRTKDAALEQGRKALETLVERKSACGDQWAECPLQDAHKPGDDVQQAIAAMKAAERTGL